MKNYVHHSKTLYGQEISNYGLQNGYVDYACLSRCFDMILNNDIMPNTADIGEWEIVNGNDYYYCDTKGNYYTETEKEEKIETLEEKQKELEETIETLEETEETNKEEIDKINNEIDSIQKDINSLDCEYYNEYYQYYIISERGYDILSELTNETVWYNEELDMYVWGISHFGTSWSYVLTDIKIELDKE